MDAGHTDRDNKQDKYTIQETSRRLDISEGAVRKRVNRGTLPYEKAPDGRVYIYLPVGVDTGVDTGHPAGVDPHNSALISEKDARIEDLHAQLEAEREANRENRRIIAGLSQSNAELSSTVRALEAAWGAQSRQEPSEGGLHSHTEATQSAGESFEDNSTGDDAEEAQAGSQEPQQPSREESQPRRSWWRRLFGG